jgi:hypothetical protein
LSFVPDKEKRYKLKHSYISSSLNIMKAPPTGIYPVVGATLTVVALASYMSLKTLFNSTDIALFKNTRSEMSDSDDAFRRADLAKEWVPMRWIAQFKK